MRNFEPDARFDTPLAPEERAWLERLRSAYVPPAMAAGRAAAFDVELHRRVEERGRRGTLWVPASAVTAAALAFWCGTLLWSATGPATPYPANTWESELFLGDDLAPDVAGDYLPEDYLVIADALFGE